MSNCPHRPKVGAAPLGLITESVRYSKHDEITLRPAKQQANAITVMCRGIQVMTELFAIFSKNTCVSVFSCSFVHLLQVVTLQNTCHLLSLSAMKGPIRVRMSKQTTDECVHKTSHNYFPLGINNVSIYIYTLFQCNSRMSIF